MLNINEAKVNFFKTIDSTNNEAQRIIENQIIDSPFWIIAESQNNGRGRGKNSWISEEGNFFATLVTPIEWDLKFFPMLSCIAVSYTHLTLPTTD